MFCLAMWASFHSKMFTSLKVMEKRTGFRYLSCLHISKLLFLFGNLMVFQSDVDFYQGGAYTYLNILCISFDVIQAPYTSLRPYISFHRPYTPLTGRRRAYTPFTGRLDLSQAVYSSNRPYRPLTGLILLLQAGYFLSQA